MQRQLSASPVRLLSGSANRSAANAQQAAANTATAEQKREFDLARSDQAPWLTTGTSALSKLAGLYGLDTVGANGQVQKGGAPNSSAFFTSPDYNFRFNQGIRGVDAGAAARGQLDSGVTRKAELAYGGNLASGEYGNYVNRLMGLAGVGQAAANTNATTGANYANNVSNIAVHQGDNLASSYLATGKTYADTIANLGGQIGGVIQNWPGSNTSGGGGGGFAYGKGGYG